MLTAEAPEMVPSVVRLHAPNKSGEGGRNERKSENWQRRGLTLLPSLPSRDEFESGQGQWRGTSLAADQDDHPPTAADSARSRVLELSRALGHPRVSPSPGRAFSRTRAVLALHPWQSQANVSSPPALAPVSSADRPPINSGKDKDDVHARAYIQFSSPDALVAFHRGYDGWNFRDKQGASPLQTRLAARRHRAELTSLSRRQHQSGRR